MPSRVNILALLLCLTACSGSNAGYPSRELRLIVQAAPGGISDTVSRVMAGLVERELGVPVVCENKPGAAGALAFSYVTRRLPDGYTLGHAPVEIAMVRSLGYADVGPDDMDLICLVSKTQPALVVQSGSPWLTFDDYLQAARRSPGRLIMGNSGTGSIWHFNALLMEQHCGIRVTHVPFNGSSASIASLLGGHIDAVVAGAGEVVGNVQGGRLRVLSILDGSRSRLFPDVPTCGEAGYDFGAPAWSGFYLPRGVPDDVMNTLEAAFRKASESADFQRLCEERGMQPLFLERSAFREFAGAQAKFFETEIPRLLRLER